MDKVDTVPEGEDEDVAAERRTVINGSNCDVALRLVNLTKVTTWVHHITLLCVICISLLRSMVCHFELLTMSAFLCLSMR